MVRTISAQDAVENVADLLGTIARTKVPIVVEDAGRSVAAIVSPEDYREQAWQRFWATVDRIQERNADKDPDDVVREVTDIGEEVRQEQHDRGRGPGGRVSKRNPMILRSDSVPESIVQKRPAKQPLGCGHPIRGLS